MKPRTKYQKQVVTSNKGLQPIKGAQMQWAFRECLDHYAFQLKHGQTPAWTADTLGLRKRMRTNVSARSVRQSWKCSAPSDRRQCLLPISAYSLSVMDCNLCSISDESLLPQGTKGRHFLLGGGTLLDERKRQGGGYGTQAHNGYLYGHVLLRLRH